MASDYKVGYGRPPKDTRFKTGESGNPSGRPKKRATPAELEKRLLLDDKMSMRITGKPRRVNAVTASLMVLVAKAASGDLRAIEYVLKRADAVKAVSADSERDVHTERANQLVDLIRDTFEGAARFRGTSKGGGVGAPEQCHDNRGGKEAMS